MFCAAAAVSALSAMVLKPITDANIPKAVINTQNTIATIRPVVIIESAKSTASLAVAKPS